MTSPSPTLTSPSPCPPPPPSLPSSPTPSSPAPPVQPPPPALPPTGEVMILALGRKKQRLLLCLSVLPNLFLAFLQSSDPLLTLSPPHRCRLPAPSRAPQVLNASLPRVRDNAGWSQCKQYQSVNGSQVASEGCEGGWDYNVTEGLRNNIVTEWDLVCERYWLVPVEEVCFILGILTGCLVLGYTADRLGRLRTLLGSLVLSVVLGVLVCISPSPSAFIVTRFCLAAATAGVYLTLYITRLELCDPSLRLLVTMAAGLTTVAGELLLLGVALGCQSWRGLLGVGTAPLALFLSYGVPGVFTESPRWLLLSDRATDLHSLSERRERERDDDGFTELEAEAPSCGRPHLSFPELLHSRNIWKNLCVLGFTSFISHGINHCYSSFRGDVRGTAPGFYWTYLLSVCSGGGAWLQLWITVDRCGRRGILLLCMTMTGLASLILLGLMEYLSESAITVFSVLGLFSSQAAASLSILFTAEVIPTVIRGSGVGVVLALGCVGRLSSPLMDLRNHYGYFLHHVVYSSLALLAVLSILLLPESKRKPLPQTLADGEQYRRPPLSRRRRDNVPLLATPNPET
ncbi:solute carrier family 22 member 17 [Scleropages formosus]|uniref:solute carrier family 22 member 17 n=1 Tax=Scleropages formosus TaxID=113540 RepID=UPI0010FACA84|nr:solute carrier family 22 member 17 [Scleropages formosus]XP_029102255.1 solute carrier family 22 member 17 [Scleropages formosus]XP_029102256.1 solute carrier family 22 member 17 [Scleropages formosus]XP_029102257.1 solute carrier family 22 member 17 [Scleropages formosus]